MTRQALALALGLAIVSVDATADQAKPRGSGGGGGSGSAGVRHHSPSGGGGSSRGGQSYSGGSPSSPGRGLSQAERRHPRAGTGHGPRYYSPYYYYPGYGYWYSPGYWPGYYYGYWPYWGAGYYYGRGYGYYGYYGAPSYYGAPYYSSPPATDVGGLRIIVEPEDTRVYVDGYFAGEAGDFDGMFERLHVAPGRHEITFKKDGHITHRVRVYVGEGATSKLRHEMEEGSGPATLEDLAGERGLYEERSPEARREEGSPAPEGEPPSGEPGPSPGDASGRPGLLNLNVSPNDASVYLDGRFFGSAHQSAEIELAPGSHRVEIVRPGYRTVDRRVEIEAGRMETLSIVLERP